MSLVFGAAGISPSNRGQQSFKYALQAGEVMLIPPGSFLIRPGLYCVIQEYNPTTTCWENVGDTGTRDAFQVNSDGVNWRVANQSGCLVGWLITNAGSSYVQSSTTITVSAGASKTTAVVGGALNSTVTVAKAGANYVYPPQVQIAAPPSPGVPATAYCTLSGGTVSTITVTNQGAGYTSVPSIVLINDPRDTAGSGATATGSLTGAGTITALLVTDHGNPVTAVPTITITSAVGSSAAATAIMAFAITSYGVTTAGAGYSASAGQLIVTMTPTITAGSAAYTNPDYQTGLVRLRPCQIAATTSGAGAITTTQQIIDGGCYESIPSAQSVQIAASTAIVTSAATLSVNVGGINDSVLMLPC